VHFIQAPRHHPRRWPATEVDQWAAGRDALPATAGLDSRRIVMLSAVALVRFAVVIGSVGCPRHVADCPA